MAQVKFEFFQQQAPKELTAEVIRSILKLLTNIEQTVLFALHDAGAALTTKQLRSFLITDLAGATIKSWMLWQKEELMYKTKVNAEKVESLSERAETLRQKAKAISQNLENAKLSEIPETLLTNKDVEKWAGQLGIKKEQLAFAIKEAYNDMVTRLFQEAKVRALPETNFNKKRVEKEGRNAVLYMEKLLKLTSASECKDYLSILPNYSTIKLMIPRMLALFAANYPSYKEVDELNKLFSSLHIEIPSFRTLDAILESLAADGYVVKRVPNRSLDIEQEGKKGKKPKIKAFWSINPRTDFYFNKLDTLEKNIAAHWTG